MNTATQKITLLLCFLITQNSITCQSGFQEYVNKTGKENIIKKIRKSIPNHYSREDGMGMGPYLTSLDQIGPIALVAFNLNSESFQQVTKTTHLSITYSLSISKEGGNAMANQFHETGVNTLKQSFGNAGIVLFTPAEFLNNQAQRAEQYRKFEPERTKAFGGIMSRGKAETAARHYAPLILSAAVCSDYKTKNSYGNDLSAALGVNACMLIEINLITEKKHIALESIRCAIVGKNPTPYQEGKKYIALIGGYPRGQVYFEGTLDLGKKGIPFVKIEKEKVAEANYDGFETLLECFAQAAIGYWNAQIAKNKKA
jgi:hypothetical protein